MRSERRHCRTVRTAPIASPIGSNMLAALSHVGRPRWPTANSTTATATATRPMANSTMAVVSTLSRGGRLSMAAAYVLTVRTPGARIAVG